MIDKICPIQPFYGWLLTALSRTELELQLEVIKGNKLLHRVEVHKVAATGVVVVIVICNCSE
jgi:hypothetical protein